MTIDVRTHSEEETMALGRYLGGMLRDGSVFALHGDLGAGKTHFVQGIAEGMGITSVVASPTFTIMNYYENTIPLQHFDFYRLEAEEELDDLGFDDYVQSGVTVIEWAEKFPDRIPPLAAVISIVKEGLQDRLFRFDFPEGGQWKEEEKEVKKYALSH